MTNLEATELLIILKNSAIKQQEKNTGNEFFDAMRHDIGKLFYEALEIAIEELSEDRCATCMYAISHGERGDSDVYID